MLERDVRNITETLGRFAPELLQARFAQEMLELFEQGELKSASALAGIHIKDETPCDLDFGRRVLMGVRASF